MKLYRYWAGAADQEDEGESSFFCYAGSDVSQEDAVRLAVEKAKHIARIYDDVDFEDITGRYAYADRALREEIVQRFEQDGKLTAAVTRNSYGSLVLNTARAMFADIDYPPPQPAGLGGLIGKLLGGKARVPKSSPDEEIIERVERVARETQNLGLRLYRTAGGFRVLATSRPFDPLSAETHDLLGRFGSDPLYVKLCRGQECFRARLTPKYWRCELDPPPPRYPWRTDADESDYRVWETEYHKAASEYATCELVAEFGPTQVHDAVADILEVHDHLALGEGKELA